MGTGWQACANQGGAFGCRPQGTISVTSDGGKTWRVLLRTPRPVVQVSIDGKHEQARFDDGETLGSSDGGRRWLPVAVGTGLVSGPCPPGSIVFAIPNWTLCGWGASAGNQMKAVYRLGPRGWKRVGTLGSYGYVQGIAMARDGFGLIWESRGTLYATRDNGVRWTGLPKVARPEIDFGVQAVALPHGVGFVVLAKGGGERRRLIETSDAGRSWRVVDTWK
ncbi:MAG TPA: hypothetical protein VGG88_01025 [Gaiellaceae bacterium]